MKPPVHRPFGARTERERKAEYDKRRPSSWKAGYNSRWNRLKDAYKAKHPLCEACEKEGVTMPMDEVDHIIPHKGNKALMYDETNLQSLCRPHHSRKTATEDSNFAKRK